MRVALKTIEFPTLVRIIQANLRLGRDGEKIYSNLANDICIREPKKRRERAKETNARLGSAGFRLIGNINRGRREIECQ